MNQKRKTACDLITAYLENVGGEATFRDILPIYHVEFAVKRDSCGRGYHRPDLATAYLVWMAKQGLVDLSYGFNGDIERIRLKSLPTEVCNGCS